MLRTSRIPVPWALNCLLTGGCSRSGVCWESGSHVDAVQGRINIALDVVLCWCRAMTGGQALDPRRSNGRQQQGHIVWAAIMVERPTRMHRDGNGSFTKATLARGLAQYVR